MKEIEFATYDHSKREWVALNPAGEEVRFPAGVIGQRLAKRTGLYTMFPAYHDWAQELVELIEEYESRIWKAAFYAAEERVDYRGQVTGLVALVEGHDPDGPYTVTTRNGDLKQYACDCPDYQMMYAPFTPAGYRMCKHILAVFLWFSLEYDPGTWAEVLQREQEAISKVTGDVHV
jgi:hypothetical protein